MPVCARPRKHTVGSSPGGIAWRVELLDEGHDRGSFDCGEPTLNLFLQAHAGQNARRDISRTFVARREEDAAIAGYYTLSSGGVEFAHLPEKMAKRLPRYPIPVAHLGRLAVDLRFQGRGLGGWLLVDALKRVVSLADQIGIHAVTVHALHERAAEFYRAFGFIALRDDPNHLYLPTATIRQLP